MSSATPATPTRLYSHQPYNAAVMSDFPASPDLSPEKAPMDTRTPQTTAKPMSNSAMYQQSGGGMTIPRKDRGLSEGREGSPTPPLPSKFGQVPPAQPTSYGGSSGSPSASLMTPPGKVKGPQQSETPPRVMSPAEDYEFSIQRSNSFHDHRPQPLRPRPSTHQPPQGQHSPASNGVPHAHPHSQLHPHQQQQQLMSHGDSSVTTPQRPTSFSQPSPDGGYPSARRGSPNALPRSAQRPQQQQHQHVPLSMAPPSMMSPSPLPRQDPTLHPQPQPQHAPTAHRTATSSPVVRVGAAAAQHKQRIKTGAQYTDPRSSTTPSPTTAQSPPSQQYQRQSQQRSPSGTGSPGGQQPPVRPAPVRPTSSQRTQMQPAQVPVPVPMAFVPVVPFMFAPAMMSVKTPTHSPPGAMASPVSVRLGVTSPPQRGTAAPSVSVQPKVVPRPQPTNDPSARRKAQPQGTESPSRQVTAPATVTPTKVPQVAKRASRSSPHSKKGADLTAAEAEEAELDVLPSVATPSISPCNMRPVSVRPSSATPVEEDDAPTAVQNQGNAQNESKGKKAKKARKARKKASSATVEPELESAALTRTSAATPSENGTSPSESRAASCGLLPNDLATPSPCATPIGPTPNAGDYRYSYTLLPAPASELEPDAHRISQRMRQIEFGKATDGYKAYTRLVPHRGLRQYNNEDHPVTPRADVIATKRRFDGVLGAWRRALHNWDDVTAAEEMAHPTFPTLAAMGLEPHPEEDEEGISALFTTQPVESRTGDNTADADADGVVNTPYMDETGPMTMSLSLSRLPVNASMDDLMDGSIRDALITPDFDASQSNPSLLKEAPSGNHLGDVAPIEDDTHTASEGVVATKQ